jgi:cell wall-associated NlpC family hydrolase
MAINPLQAFPLATALPVPVGLNKQSGSTIFDTVLGSLRAAGSSSSPMAGQQAAADLFRIQMMQKTLSLSGEDATPASGFSALEALLAGPAELCRQSGRVSRPPGGAAAAPAVVPAAPAGEPAASAAASEAVGSIGSTAAQYLGTPYRFGGEGANGDGIDCSSFVQQVFREHQVDLPRTAREQSKVGSDVAPGDLRKGDLVFFHTYAAFPSHVGIYLGEGKMIHASSGKGEVTVSDLNSDYYRSRYLGAKRVA